MQHLYALGETVAYTGIVWAIHLLEAMGFVVVLCSAVRAFIDYWTSKSLDPFRSCRLRLAEGLATGLEFKLGGEILRTVIVREWGEIMVLGAIVVLRVVMALMIYWEMGHEKSQSAEDKVEA